MTEQDKLEIRSAFEKEIRASEARIIAALRPASRLSSGGPVAVPTVLPNYGRAKGVALVDATDDDLGYYENNARKTLADQSKASWHAKEQAMIDAIVAERARRAGPASEDVPF